MAYFERIRDRIWGPFSMELVQQRTAAGWKMVSIEWRRQLPDDESPTEGEMDEDIPYGLRISDDCTRLEAEPNEHKVLLEIMEMLGQDFSYSAIVGSLNEKGYRMRDGSPWNRVAIFKMIPRLIEVGPNLFRSGEWEQRRRRFEHPQPPQPI
jgi:Recombinase